MDGLTGFQRDILYTIIGQERPHGIDIKEQLSEYYAGSVSNGRVYSNLDILVERGYVDKEPETERSNRYVLTEAGIETVFTHRQWEERQVGQRLKRGARIADIDSSA